MERKRATSTASDKKYASIIFFFYAIQCETIAATGTTAAASHRHCCVNEYVQALYYYLFKWWCCDHKTVLSNAQMCVHAARARLCVRSTFVVDYQQLEDFQKMWLYSIWFYMNHFRSVFSFVCVLACAGYCQRPLTIGNYYYYRRKSDINVFLTSKDVAWLQSPLGWGVCVWEWWVCGRPFCWNRMMWFCVSVWMPVVNADDDNTIGECQNDIKRQITHLDGCKK